ncbi:MAG: undecaprenyldiphospho-muramoylpentapeptide beta-N-acetylglucosaminyltransferase [Parvularculales bacterium]
MKSRFYSKDQRLVAIATGGTGGHLFPGLALAEELGRRGYGVVLMTDERMATIAHSSFEVGDIYVLPSATFSGRRNIMLLVAFCNILRGVWRSWKIIRQLRPAVVVGFGGYPSLPPLVAAWLRRVPFCLHEQNAVMGRVNRFMAFGASGVAAGFSEPIGFKAAIRKRLTITGNPVRSVVQKYASSPYQVSQGSDPFRLLVVGGSQGARLLDDVMPCACANLPLALKARMRITQQCRPENTLRVRNAYKEAGISAIVEDFYNDLPKRMMESHLIIARAGASCVSELAVIGRPSVLTPLAGTLDGDQVANAQYLSHVGAAWVIPQESFTPEAVSTLLVELATTPGQLEKVADAALQEGRPNAVCLLADLVEELCGNKGRKRHSGRQDSSSQNFIEFLAIMLKYRSWRGQIS